jgi:hypothetical protein
VLLGEVTVVLLLVTVYDRVRDIAATRADLAVANAYRVLHVEAARHLDPERLLNSWLAAHPHVEWLASWYYQVMHLSVTLVVLAWLYWFRPSLYRRARNSLVLVNVIGLVVFWLLPVAPPRLLAGFTDSGVASGVAEHVNHISPDVYAAMPSLHLAWATWVVAQVWFATSRGWARGLAVTHLAITTVVVVATGNHFLLDVVAGMAVGLFATRAQAISWSGLSRRTGLTRAAAWAGGSPAQVNLVRRRSG